MSQTYKVYIDRHEFDFPSNPFNVNPNDKINFYLAPGRTQPATVSVQDQNGDTKDLFGTISFVVSSSTTIMSQTVQSSASKKSYTLKALKQPDHPRDPQDPMTGTINVPT
ncbi:hypothetical protein [Archangium sp.]|uniref:hypothetical protein n=1 Tax=Archangium sp. TaxID=1872627 RepID=UPI003899CD9B